MNSESACASETKSFCVETIAFEQVPHQSKLFLDFQSGAEKTRKYYPQEFSKDYAREVLENYQTDRDKLCEALERVNKTFGASEKTLEHIKLLREKDCVAVVTGQQAGLLTGALYTVYKALSAVRLAENLRQQGIKAVPVFWIAEEDHDFDEVKKTFVINRDAQLAEIENSPQKKDENSPVGFIELDATIAETEAKLFDELRNSEFSGELKNLLSETYGQGETYSSAFAKLATKLFAKYGLIIFPPLDEDLKKLSASIYAAAINNSEAIGAALLKRTKELESENYHAQVLVEKDFFPFFLIEKGRRLALKKNEKGNYQVKGTKYEFTLAELVEIAENEPQKLSPNALMRSIVQDYLLPTVTYFGGAAEIAYFAQNAEIYRILDRPATPIKHRASVTIVEPKNRRTLEKYQLKLTDLFDGQEAVYARIVNEFLAKETFRTFEESEKAVNERLDVLRENLGKSEPTLAANLETRRRKIQYHLDALLKKFQRAEIQKDEVVRRRLEFLFTSLMPHKALQERTLNVTYFLNLYGENFVDWIYEIVSDEEKSHQIFYL